MITLTNGTHLVTITPEAPVVRYRIYCTSPAKIYTTGVLDSYCTVLDSSLNVVGNFDDNIGNNFYFELPDNFAYGEYYLDVSLYNQLATNAQFNLVYDSPVEHTEHSLLCALLPDVSEVHIEQRLLSPLLFDLTLFSHELPCPSLSDTHTEQTLLCPFFGVAFVSHELKINDVAQIGHDLIIGQWVTSYTPHTLPVLMTALSFIDHSLLCPLAAVDQAVMQSHLLSVPLFSVTDTVVVDVHSLEIPTFGAY